MKFLSKFINWIQTLHKGATTRFLLSFTTSPISITFSVRQGDAISMVLYILYLEPFLIKMHEVCSGIVLKSRLHKSLNAPLVDGVDDDLESFVDDVEGLCSSDQDFINIDKLVSRFEQVSGAILSRTQKSVVLGLGGWQDRTQWPLDWLKTVTSTTIFGFILSNKYSIIIEENWKSH